MQLNVRHYATEEWFVRSFHYDILAEPLFTATDVMHLSVTSRLKVNCEVQVPKRSVIKEYLSERKKKQPAIQIKKGDRSLPKIN